jgi:hypothetical protein
MFHIYRDRYSRGFKAGVGRFVVGIRPIVTNARAVKPKPTKEKR